jgi:hypothetical protein
MAVRSCRGPIQDLDGVSHTVEVTAATLYEAVAQGLSLIRRGEWVAGIAKGLNVVKVSVADVRDASRFEMGAGILGVAVVRPEYDGGPHLIYQDWIS